MKTSILTLALTLGLAAAGTSQQGKPMTAYGKVWLLPPVSFCMDGAKYALECTNIRMKDNPASSVDAGKFIGKWVKVEGHYNPGITGPSCDNLALTKISAATEYLDAAGSTPTPGGTLTFGMYGPIGSLHALLMAAGRPKLQILMPFGSLHLPLTSPIFQIMTVPIPATGVANLKLPIPNVPALKGTNLTFQSAMGFFKPTLGVMLLNAECIAIK